MSPRHIHLDASGRPLLLSHTGSHIRPTTRYPHGQDRQYRTGCMATWWRHAGAMLVDLALTMHQDAPSRLQDVRPADSHKRARDDSHPPSKHTASRHFSQLRRTALRHLVAGVACAIDCHHTFVVDPSGSRVTGQVQLPIVRECVRTCLQVSLQFAPDVSSRRMVPRHDMRQDLNMYRRSLMCDRELGLTGYDHGGLSKRSVRHLRETRAIAHTTPPTGPERVPRYICRINAIPFMSAKRHGIYEDWKRDEPSLKQPDSHRG